MRPKTSVLVALGFVASSLLFLLLYVSLEDEQGFAPESNFFEATSNETAESISRESEVPIAERKPASQLVSQETSPIEGPTTGSTPSGTQETDEPRLEQGERDSSQSEELNRINAGEIETDVPRLSQRIVDVISEVQTRQLDGQWEEALNEMNALYIAFDELNPFEQSTLLNFYTNTLFQLEMWQESISAFSLMLTIPDLRPDVNARALMTLGQLHNRVGEPEAAITYYEYWLAFTDEMANMEDQTQRVKQLLTQARATSN